VSYLSVLLIWIVGSFIAAPLIGWRLKQATTEAPSDQKRRHVEHKGMR
jgi:hypothetical protein